MNEKYIKDLISLVKDEAATNGDSKILYVLRNAQAINVDLNYHDNWDGGIDYYDVFVEVDRRIYREICKELDSIENELLELVRHYHHDEYEIISSMKVRSVITRVLDWEAIYPDDKNDVLEALTDEKNLLLNIATGKARIQDEDDRFKSNHKQLVEWADVIGFDYPVTFKSLWDWYNFYSPQYAHYSERRAYISELYDPIFEQIENDLKFAEEGISFNISSSESPTIHKAIVNANNCLSSGNYEEAIDRVHTSFHGYLRELLSSHGIEYLEGDTLQQLYKKLHSYYEESIQPKEVASLIKTCLRSATGIVTALNEIRNNHSMAHPNEHLIGKREAKLVIQFIQDIVSYLEDIETSICCNEQNLRDLSKL